MEDVDVIFSSTREVCVVIRLDRDLPRSTCIVVACDNMAKFHTAHRVVCTLSEEPVRFKGRRYCYICTACIVHAVLLSSKRTVPLSPSVLSRVTWIGRQS